MEIPDSARTACWLAIDATPEPRSAAHEQGTHRSEGWRAAACYYQEHLLLPAHLEMATPSTGQGPVKEYPALKR